MDYIELYRTEMNMRTFPKHCVRYVPITFRKSEYDRDNTAPAERYNIISPLLFSANLPAYIIQV